MLRDKVNKCRIIFLSDNFFDNIPNFFNMVHFFVSVNEGQKNIISQQVIKVEDTCTFNEIYEAITEGVFGICNVKVYVSKEDGKWNYLREGLHDNVTLMSELELKYVRFVVQTEENNTTQQNQQFERNAFNIMMEHSRKPYFPLIKREDTRRDVLYNDVIALLKENQKNGWREDQEKIAKMFIKQLVDLLWYIDPHHDTLAARSLHLPNIFKELAQYQCDSHYNNFYYTSHHKKEQLKREKLEQIAESLELTIGQPWASEIKWADFILEVFELINIINQYAKYLQRVNNEVNVRHTSNMVSRNVSQDLQVYTVEKCSEIDAKYQELSFFFCLTKMIMNSLILKNIFHLIRCRDIVIFKICNLTSLSLFIGITRAIILALLIIYGKFHYLQINDQKQKMRK